MAEVYLSESEDEEITTFNIYNNIIDKKDENTFLISLTFRELLAYTMPWCFNRTINDDKVNELYDSLCLSYSIPFILQAVYDEKHTNPVSKILILDGQHRLEAIRKYIELNDSTWQCTHKVWVCVHKLEYAESTNASIAIELFKKINNNRVLDQSELPDMFIADLVRSVCDIVLFRRQKVIGMSTVTSSCHSPCIHKKELSALFNEHKDLIKNGNKTIKELVENIQKINHFISIKSFEDLYLVKHRSSEKTRWQKAVSKSFFLNLKNSRFTPDIWIQYINNANIQI